MSGDGFIPEGADSGGAITGRWLNPKDWPNDKDSGGQAVRWRFLSGLSSGFTGWSGGKPVRAPEPSMFTPGLVWDSKDFGGKIKTNTPARTWAGFGYCPDSPGKEIMAMEITQPSLFDALKSVIAKGWGNPLEYDLIFARGKDKKGFLSYSVSPHPSGKTPLPPDIQAKWDAFKAGGADMSLLYTTGDPFPQAANGGAAAAAGDDGLPF